MRCPKCESTNICQNRTTVGPIWCGVCGFRVEQKEIENPFVVSVVSVISHLELRRPSIEKIKVLCEQCLDHDSSWYEFTSRLDDIVKRETRTIRSLSKNTI